MPAAQETLRNGSLPRPPGFSFGPAIHYDHYDPATPPLLVLCLNQRQHGTAVCAPPLRPHSEHDQRCVLCLVGCALDLRRGQGGLPCAHS